MAAKTTKITIISLAAVSGLAFWYYKSISKKNPKFTSDFTKPKPVVSIILPVYNAEPYLDEAFASIAAQTFLQQQQHGLEVSVYDDGSTDGSYAKILEWQQKLASSHPQLTFTVGRNLTRKVTKGIGHACNSSITQASGTFLCRFDADDVMAPDRILIQYNTAHNLPPSHPLTSTLIGARFIRRPLDATPRYTKWLNNLSTDQLMSQRFREVTLLHPTWFFHRAIWARVGGYTTDMSLPEDLIFFYKHVENGGSLYQVKGKPLLEYRYLASQRSWKVHRKTLLAAKIAHFERQVLSTPEWQSFSIWGAGRDGKDTYKALSAAARARVTCFWDVDVKKIGSVYVDHITRRKIPILSRDSLKPPVILCVASDRANGLEQYLEKTLMKDGTDYYHMC